MWWKKSPCPDNDVTGEAENFSDYPRISVNKNNISCLLGGCNCPFLLAKCLSCWHRCWILFPLFNKRGNNYSRMERQRKVLLLPKQSADWLWEFHLGSIIDKGTYISSEWNNTIQIQHAGIVFVSVHFFSLDILL